MVDNRVLGVPIEGERWDSIEARLDRGERLWIVTANPEILLKAKKDRAYREIISSADLRTVDGAGLFFVTNVLRRKTERLTGVDLSGHLLQYVWKHHLRVGLLGGENGEAEDAAGHVRDAYPDLEVLAEQGGTVSEDGAEDEATEMARERMMLFSPHILLVAFGHPRQERWIASHRNDFADLRAAVGVGGTFTFWSGRIKRAPAWMRAVGIEWFFRLIQEPKRWRRIWNAVVVFPIVALIDNLFSTE
jgi:N-acetylglucosaminyldiphosphoundecaprenol N-acetyl-beta-D-mannosaminyltransferase